MTAAVPGSKPGRPASVRTMQHARARDHITVRLYHLAEPWAAWLALAVLAAGLRLAFPGAVLAFAVAVLGSCLALLDHHLRSHRTKFVGRWIGPLTAAACTGWLSDVVYAGWSKPLLEAWLAGGLALCIAWDIWIVAGDHHDLARAFVPAAEAAGMGGLRLSRIFRKPGSTVGQMQLPRGELKTSDVAGRLEHLEGALGYPPGSWSVTNDRGDAGMAQVMITDPQLLDAAPLPWPGPSAPGESVAVPFRTGVWADGEPFRYDVLPLHQLREMGATGAGKSESWWSYFAEGITRHDYACLAADVTKGDQFLGPLRPAMNFLATSEEEARELLAAVHRIIRARCDWLARSHLTVWKPGCGLRYLDVRLEEAPDIIALLDAKARREWISDVRAARSSGVAWRQSYQRADHTQVPTVTRGQMGYWCYGVMERKDAEFGLSDLQRERGCRPELWGADIPGKMYADTVTVPAERKTVPARQFWWGPDSRRIADYVREWPADRRPLDDVTGEALEARPGRGGSTALPVPALAQNGARNGAQAGVQDTPAPQSFVPPPSRRNRMNPDAAEKRLAAQLDAYRADGRRFTARQLMNDLGEEVVCTGKCGDPCCTGRTRGWLYAKITELAGAGVLREDGGSPTRWVAVPEDRP